MKKLLVVVTFLALVVGLFLFLAQKPHPQVIFTGNTAHRPVDFFPHAYQCSECKMPLESKKYSAEVVAPDGKTWFFDDVGCMGAWIARQPFKDAATVWVYTLDTKRWFDGRKAHYSVLESTPMGYGFGAYEKPGNHRIDFAAMVSRMERGENLTNQEYAKKLVRSLKEGE
ncbi:hypothetical protein [Hydrogenimonas sp.]